MSNGQKVAYLVRTRSNSTRITATNSIHDISAALLAAGIDPRKVTTIEAIGVVR